MPDELTDYLIQQAEDTRDLKRQLGELDKVTGIQIKKEDTVKIIVKQFVINKVPLTGNGLVWGNSGYGIWGTDKWNTSANAFGSPTTHYDSGDLE